MGITTTLPDHVKVCAAKPKWLPGGVTYQISDDNGQILKEVESHPLVLHHDEEHFASSILRVPNFKGSRAGFFDALSSELSDILQTRSVKAVLTGKYWMQY